MPDHRGPAAPAVPIDVIERWMDSRSLGRGAIRDVAPIAGGTQNIMVRFSRDDQGYVLRRGPQHVRSATNKVLSREIRVLQALAATDVPHPRLLAACTDVDVLGDSVFYLMEPVDGINVGVTLPEPQRSDRSMRRTMGFGFVDALIKIAHVEPHTIGLGELGRSDGFLERQVRRWTSELESYASLDGYDSNLSQGFAELATWLEERRPEEARPGLLHGDYHLSNVMFDPVLPHVAAVVDWEMATVGDPLLDLGWVLAVWPDEPDEPDLFGSELSRCGGLPTREELVTYYADNVDRDLSNMPWYAVLACFKLGILLEGTYARSLAGLADEGVGLTMRAYATALVARGLTTTSRSSSTL